MAERTCTICASPLTGRQAKYCQPLCAHRALHRARTEDGRKAAGRATRDKAKCAEYNRANRDKLKAADAEGYYERQRAYEANRRAKRRAAGIRKKPLTSERVKAARRKIRSATRGKTGKGIVWAQGPCALCRTPFLAVSVGVVPAAYCSKACRESAARDRRRALKTNAFVAPVWRKLIFERDHWRCKICRKPVKRTAVVPHPKAPVIDHILPLAAGGKHEPANVQCAHFLCNSIKRDQPADDQLRLIG